MFVYLKCPKANTGFSFANYHRTKTNKFREIHAMKFFVAATLILALFKIPSLHADTPKSDTKKVEGTWQGTLKVGAVELRLAFKISKKPDGSLTATLDSIDQGAKDIPVDEVTWKDPDLKIELKKIGGVFEGKANKDYSQFEGTWKQSGGSWPLTIKRVEKATELKRPQEPKKPYPYVEEDVTYDNPRAGIKLAGTLTRPQGDGRFPAVLLIAGSGPHARNEEVFGHKVFMVLADYLTRRGIVVLRSDKRGVGKSTGKYDQATSADFADDALAGVEYLKTRKEVDPHKIGLVGHSEGGIVAPMVAARSKDVVFIVLMAGTGVTGEEILYRQGTDVLKTMGVDDKAVAQHRVVLERMFQVLKEEKDRKAAEKKMHEAIAQEVAKMGDEEKKKVEAQKAIIEGQVQLMLSPWMRYFLLFDPQATLSLVHCPVLAINGAKDVQVAADVNLPAIEQALRSGGNADVTVRELPNLNHLFQTSKTGAVSEYAQIEETMSATALALIGDWIASRANRPPAEKAVTVRASEEEEPPRMLGRLRFRLRNRLRGW
jgi:pimeloyl-ACP methyl ester carboxylesterase